VSDSRVIESMDTLRDYLLSCISNNPGEVYFYYVYNVTKLGFFL